MNRSRHSFSMTGVANIDDLRTSARRHLPRVVFDYIDGGADAEITLSANREVFDKVMFRPKQAVESVGCDLSTKVLKDVLSLPVILAPIGHSSVIYPRGEIAAATAAGNAGTAYILSTLSSVRLEDVKAASTGPLWYQLYLWGGRAVAESAIARARESGYTALVVTVDSPVAGKRERDIRNGALELVSRSVFSNLPFLWQLAFKPSWLWDFLRSENAFELANVVLPAGGQGVPIEKYYHTITWSDFDWIRRAWDGPLAVKGILTADDARRAVDVGADAVIVSNHGGRQLDCVPASLSCLSEVVDAVGQKTEVLMDGGVRRGSDVVKALCLGARAVLCGRAYAYGLAAAGEQGVATVLSIFQEDLKRTLALLGCSSVNSLDSSFISK
jgi:isopentenyl diphosphate isomerase/L-lactate dehydrogenase-like FMN-dependent dehydrogenase